MKALDLFVLWVGLVLGSCALVYIDKIECHKAIENSHQHFFAFLTVWIYSKITQKEAK